MKAITVTALTVFALAVCSATLATDAKQDVKFPGAREAEQASELEVKLSDIPGITTPDRTPHACADCHKTYPEMEIDGRLTTALAGWKEATDPRILEKARAAAPAGRTLAGRHPDISALVKIVPDDCLMCHSRDSWAAPPFTKLLHAIHLVGGKENHFLTLANGTCTNCHKLDEQTGTWHLGSGKEK
jgi:hypothetical protein